MFRVHIQMRGVLLRNKTYLYMSKITTSMQYLHLTAPVTLMISEVPSKRQLEK